MKSLFFGPMRRFVRRSLIVLLVINLAMVLGIVLGSLLPPFVMLWLLAFHPYWLWLLLLLPFFLLLRLYLTTGGIAFKHDSVLDERERALRNQATHISYRLLTRTTLALVVIAAILLLTGTFFPRPWIWWLVSDSGATPILLILLLLLAMFGLLMVLLPSTVIAWLEPDPVEESTPPSHEVAP